MSTNLVYRMSMPCCKNCGRQLRILYEDHAELTKQLTEELETTDIPVGRYVGRVSGKDITGFIKTYYTWASKPENKTKIKFQPLNVVARGLLSLKVLTEEMLPFGQDREKDGQISILSESICCMLMLQCNPALSV